MLNDVFTDLDNAFKAAMEAFRRDLMKVRTGRANLGMLDGVKVEFYGTLTPLNQVGTLKVADPRLITVQPWDKSLIPSIEKAITASDLGLNPSNDGSLVRIPIPALTGERRKELVKIVKRHGEDAKVAIRNERRDANEMAKELEKDGQVTEDELHRALDRIQKMTDDQIKRVDDLLAEKEKEVTDF